MMPPLLRLSGIGKAFGAVRVLDDVSFELRAGEVHLLAGENGAGKSTLIKVLAGIHADFEGTIEIDGKRLGCASPQDAARHGISVIHQETSLVDDMSVEDNLLLGSEPARLGGWWLDRVALRRRTRELCRQLGLNLTPAELRRPVGSLALPVKSRIEIARAVARAGRILVMDEPTSALNRAEVDTLFALIAGLKRRGCGVIYISHKMDEIYRVADRITVLRDGRHVGTADSADCPESQLIEWMIGRTPVPPATPAAPSFGPLRLEAKDIRVPVRRVGGTIPTQSISLGLHGGEIVGLAGLQGSGGSELLAALFGARGRIASGSVMLDGRPFHPLNPRSSIARGLVHLTADRRDSGIVPQLSVAANISLASLPKFSSGGWLRPAVERRRARDQADMLRLRCHSLEQSIETLSGGNQQKAVLARWLETDPNVLLLDEPTRGIDVGAKQEIHELLRAWSAGGGAILLHSTDLAELLAVADRILVLHDGAVAGEFARREATIGGILALAMGGPRTKGGG